MSGIEIGSKWVGRTDGVLIAEVVRLMPEKSALQYRMSTGLTTSSVECFLRDFKPMSEQAKLGKHSHYFIPVADLEFIDVYHLCKRAKIQDDSGATHHALKKLLFSGKRGSKDRIKDLQEAADTILRLIEIERLESEQ